LTYAPYSETLSSLKLNPLPNEEDMSYQFNGKERDEETGLHYYGARYYDAELGIWLSVDPLAEIYPWISMK